MAGRIRGGGERFPALDGARGLAALSVVVYHAWQHGGLGQPRPMFAGTWSFDVLSNLDAGVAFFFVLSGFLVFLPFARAAAQGARSPSVKRFLQRRALRILPLYYTAILLVWASRYSGLAEQRLDLLQHLAFLQIFDRVHVFWTIGPAWSLSDEVLYYLMLAGIGPLLALACARLRPRARACVLVGAPLALIAVSVADKAWAFAAHVPFDDWPTYFGPVARLDGFALGMLLASVHALRGGRPLPAKPLLALAIPGMALLAWAFVHRSLDPQAELYFHTLAAAGFALLLAPAILGPERLRAPRVWASRPMVGLGVVSYSLYLWHEPILVQLAQQGVAFGPTPAAFATGAAELVVLAILASCASYWVIERPALRWKPRRRSERVRQGREAEHEHRHRQPAPRGPPSIQLAEAIQGLGVLQAQERDQQREDEPAAVAGEAGEVAHRRQPQPE
jgi:peptidoglycan/LPS O-acetylase OafA/YrhL